MYVSLLEKRDSAANVALNAKHPANWHEGS